MGLYIDYINKQQLPIVGKAEAILNLDPEASIIDKPELWQEGIVCVVYNEANHMGQGPPFEAAGYAYDQRELTRFQNPNDTRPKTWLMVPGAKDYAE